MTRTGRQPPSDMGPSRPRSGGTNPERLNVQHHRHPKPYKEGDDWRESHSFGPGELPTVAKVMLDAHTWVQEEMASEREEERQSQSRKGREPARALEVLREGNTPHAPWSSSLPSQRRGGPW